MTCPRPHCGGLILDRSILDAEGWYLQRICAACGRGVTVPRPKVYVERSETSRARRVSAAPSSMLSLEERRARYRDAAAKARASRARRGLCARGGCPNDRAEDQTHCEPCRVQKAKYALAWYYRLKKRKIDI